MLTQKESRSKGQDPTGTFGGNWQEDGLGKEEPPPDFCPAKETVPIPYIVFLPKKKKGTRSQAGPEDN